MQHEVHAGEGRRLQRVGRLVGSLGVGNFRCTQPTAAAKRNTEATCQRCGDEQYQRGLRRAEGRRAGLHRHRRSKGAEDHRGTGPDQLHVSHPRQRLRQDLRQRAGHGNR